MTKPAELSAWIGGYAGPNFLVKLEGGRLRYEASDRHDESIEETLHPTDDQWDSFVAELEAARVWSWDREYSCAGVVDGTSWSFRIDLAGRRHESSGSNAFPTTFDRFKRAISRLVGGREFR